MTSKDIKDEQFKEVNAQPFFSRLLTRYNHTMLFALAM